PTLTPPLSLHDALPILQRRALAAEALAGAAPGQGRGFLDRDHQLPRDPRLRRPRARLQHHLRLAPQRRRAAADRADGRQARRPPQEIRLPRGLVEPTHGRHLRRIAEAAPCRADLKSRPMVGSRRPGGLRKPPKVSGAWLGCYRGAWHHRPMDEFEAYLVGGAVRDALLGIDGGDRDWVVVGQTPEAMRARGFRAVGRDFPVFLHPDTGEEYALARTERKSGRGHRGFVVDADPSVTLEEDLGRRDFTINAIAQRPDGTLVDPLGGARDLEARVLRHVGPAFVEDPLRVLRAARFMARLAPLGFRVADETRTLMREMVAAGELAELVPERVWQELVRAL